MTKTIKNALTNLTKKLNSIKARDIMTKTVITASEDEHLAEVAHTMIDKRISGLPVVNKKGKIVGIITATDFFLVMDMIKSGDIAESGKVAITDPTVKFAMSTEVIKIKKDTTLNKIITIMKYRNAHTLPVFEGSKLVGVVGRRDVFKNFYAAVKEVFS